MEHTWFLAPALLAFAVSVVLCPLFIPFLKHLHAEQPVREDGPETHRKKGGTPTMGGVVLLLSVVITSLLYLPDFPDIASVLFFTLAFGSIGFLDDCLKIVRKRSMGLKPYQKLLLQSVVTGLFAYYYRISGQTTKLLVPFSGGTENGLTPELGGCFFPFLFLVVLGTVNGANLTDGLDGLASGVTLMIAVFLSVVTVVRGSGLAPITCAVAGALLGFLIYNVYPAKVFLGDTGSLALGGFVAVTAFLLQIPLFIGMIGIVYLAETLSVLLQVSVFRLSHGKRLFRMAPLHHHFELCGWQETKISTLFIVITALFCVAALFGV